MTCALYTVFPVPENSPNFVVALKAYGGSRAGLKSSGWVLKTEIKYMEFSFHVLVFLHFKLLFMGIFLKKIIYCEIPKLVNMFFTNRHSYYPWLLDCIFQMTIAFKTMSFSVVLSSHQKPKRLPEILSFFSSKIYDFYST